MRKVGYHFHLYNLWHCVKNIRSRKLLLVIGKNNIPVLPRHLSLHEDASIAFMGLYFIVNMSFSAHLKLLRILLEYVYMPAANPIKVTYVNLQYMLQTQMPNMKHDTK